MDPIAQAEEDLRRERLMAVFSRFLPWAGLLLVLVLASVGVREIMDAMRDSQNKKQTEALVTAMNGPDSLSALEKASQDLEGSHAALAKLILFQRMPVEKQKNEGIALLDQLAADEKTAKEWRDYAALSATKARIAFGATEKDAGTLLAAIEPVVNDDNSPWQTAARIQKSLIESVMKGDNKAALKTLELIDLAQIDPKLAAQVNSMRLQFLAASAEEPK